MRLAPVLVIVDAVRTAELPAGPGPTRAVATAAGWASITRVPTATGHAASQ
jgi:hypothetical protein